MDVFATAYYIQTGWVIELLDKRAQKEGFVLGVGDDTWKLLGGSVEWYDLEASPLLQLFYEVSALLGAALA